MVGGSEVSGDTTSSGDSMQTLLFSVMRHTAAHGFALDHEVGKGVLFNLTVYFSPKNALTVLCTQQTCNVL